MSQEYPDKCPGHLHATRYYGKINSEEPYSRHPAGGFSLVSRCEKALPFKVGINYGLTDGGGGTFNLYHEDVSKGPGCIGRPTFNLEA